MKVKLCILENDEVYLNRINTVFNTKYSDKFEIYSFTNKDLAIQTLKSNHINVFIADESFNIVEEEIPSYCGFAYFTANMGMSEIRQQRAICKYQKAELIYKEILSIFSENAGNNSKFKLGNEDTKTIAFTSVSGGVGNSVVAAACAQHFASLGKKTLYLNLEKYGSSDCFFKGEGQFNMSDIIFAIKTKIANIPMKLESCVKQDRGGVFFFSQPHVVLDMLELKKEEMKTLVKEIQTIGIYDYIIIDMEFDLSKEMFDFLSVVNSVVWISDGTDITNTKLFRVHQSLTLLDNEEEQQVLNKLMLIYNKYSSKGGKLLNIESIKNIGGINFFADATDSQLITELSAKPVFDKIV